MSIQNSDNENFRASVVSNDELQVVAVFTSKQKVNEVINLVQDETSAKLSN